MSVLQKDDSLEKETTNICSPISELSGALLYKDFIVSFDNVHVFKRGPFVLPNFLGECHQNISKFHAKPRLDRYFTPKTIVCHDMKGGYLEDRFIDGCNIGNGYTFYRWNEIDIFIYFSHHLITIPPPGWVKIAHKNNVKILGTVITEGKFGEAICEEIFKSDDSWHEFARSLINIAVLNSFDGWLLNIENKISTIGRLVDFVTHLTAEMHKINPEFVVLWYDSVIKDGSLKWQNELNDFNKCFFDACDGIFLNYTWNKNNLKRSVAKAGFRVLDVFVGIDVFGRNCYGGGGFNTNAAAELIRKFGLSMAIFAPGWTHERMPENCGDNFFFNFCQRDNGFWLNLIPYLYTHPVIKPFATTFYLGADKNSYYLNTQELVITRPVHCGNSNCITDNIDEDCFCIQLHSEGCKPNTVSYLITKVAEDKTNKLFTCNIDVNTNVAVSYITKNVDNKKGELNIMILTRNKLGRIFNFRMTTETRNIRYYYDNYVVSPIANQDPLHSVIADQIKFENISEGWTRNNFLFSVPSPMTILEVTGYVDGNCVLFGGFGIQIDLNVDV